MTTKNEPKSFDAIKFKQQAQAQIYEEIKDMTPEEEIAYFRERALSGPLGEWWSTLPVEQSTATPSA